MLELRCSRDLAWALGAISPETIAHHKTLRDAGHLMVRDIETSWPMFWPWQLSRDHVAEAMNLGEQNGL
jgi:hypothetical protein